MATLLSETWDGADGSSWPSGWEHIYTNYEGEPHTDPILFQNKGRHTSPTGISWGYSAVKSNFLVPNFGTTWDLQVDVTLDGTNGNEDWFVSIFANADATEVDVSYDLTPNSVIGWFGWDYNGTFGTLPRTLYAQLGTRVEGIGTSPDAAVSIPGTESYTPGDTWTIRIKRDGLRWSMWAWPKGGAPSVDPITTHAEAGPEPQHAGDILALNLTNGGQDLSFHGDWDNLLLTDGAKKVLAYFGNKSVIAAYYGTTPLSSLKLGGPVDRSLVYAESFSGPDGSPWPSPPWRTREPELQAAHVDQITDIQQGAGRMHAGFSYSVNIADLDGLDPLGDSEMYFTFQPNMDDKEKYFYAIILGNRQYPAGAGDWFPGNCYYVDFYWGDISWGEPFRTYWSLKSRPAGGSDTAVNWGSEGNLSSDRPWAVRIQRVGTVLRFRVWDAVTTEPSDWIEGTIPPEHQGWTGRPGLSFAEGGGDPLWVDIRDLVIRDLSLT